MQRIITVTVLLFSLAVLANGSISVGNVLSDMKNPMWMVDGKSSTVSEGKAGENIIIFQFGQLRFISTIRLNLNKVSHFKEMKIFSSDNFIEWNEVWQRNNLSGKAWDIELQNLSGLFLKITINAESEFGISEIEFYQQAIPANKIYDIKVSDVTESTATISWKTAIKSQDYFYYMKKVNGTRETIIDVSASSNHSVQLKGLLKGNEYIFQIISESPNGARIASEEFTFKTKGIPLPEIWELKALNINPFSASIYYKSNIPTTMSVQLGKSKDDLKTILTDNKLREEGQFDIKGLQPETTYFYKLILKDKFENVVMTPAIPFYTPAHNLALGKKVWGTFNYPEPEIQNLGYGKPSVERAVDGNLNFFEGTAVSFNADNSDQYIIVDLGKVSSIERIDIYWWALSYSRDYRIDLSLDGNTWETVKEHLDAEGGTEMSSPAGDYLVMHSIPINKNALFIRLYISANAKRGCKDKKWDPRDYLYISELAVIEKI